MATSFEVTAEYLPGVKTVLTGLPVRADIAQGERFSFVPHDSFTVFVTGGSQGLKGSLPYMLSRLKN